MNAELKTKWLNGLRSGQYEQGKTHLRSMSGRYCCLGVLADVAGLAWTPHGTVYRLVDAPPQEGTALLPEPVCKLLGLERQGKLTEMNDNGKTFSEIANYIEANL